eukprot:525408-Hanusia_phi.AAC.1
MGERRREGEKGREKGREKGKGREEQHDAVNLSLELGEFGILDLSSFLAILESLRDGPVLREMRQEEESVKGDPDGRILREEEAEAGLTFLLLLPLQLHQQRGQRERRARGRESWKAGGGGSRQVHEEVVDGSTCACMTLAFARRRRRRRGSCGERSRYWRGRMPMLLRGSWAAWTRSASAQDKEGGRRKRIKEEGAG